ncbi:DNA-binding response regulator [Paenibacillus ginsengarvi]|uniref:DNA-binding response regulator n=2 Tax=Paenibacillus ginsengarvi TaxID=400777 RepID=A0A3B0CHM6_9BACL|nr:DNA-binding response regulator [Paenibacillus ginsengarvi]
MHLRKAYEEWMAEHIGRRSEERQRRLLEGLGHVEKWFAEAVWWPAFESFEYLHPEYEVQDFRDGLRYLDFAYIRGMLRVCIEIDGYGPHRRDLNRKPFSEELNRQNHLVIDGWLVIRFSYDDEKEKPRQCQQMLQQLIGKHYGTAAKPEDGLTVLEREAVRLAFGQNGLVKPGELFAYLGVGRKRGLKLIESLVRKKWLIPVPGTQRVRAYRVCDNRSLPV